MPSLTKRWDILPTLPPEADLALQAYSPLLRQLLYNRGIADPLAAEEFLSPRPLQDPPPMLGMEEAVARLVEAIRSQELIAVYGDYDVDGVTATALLVQVLAALGARVAVSVVREEKAPSDPSKPEAISQISISETCAEVDEAKVSGQANVLSVPGKVVVPGYIPNRFDEGYGLNNDALESLCQEGVKVVVTVDCGIRSVREAEFARGLGMDLIITDHHHPEAELPPAFAIINPTQPGDPYPFKYLSGVGLAYKLAEALVARMEAEGQTFPELDLEGMLDLVALGTVADLVTLSGENRYLVHRGLQVMRRCQRQGLLSLIGACGLNQERLTAGDISFILGPRLNASGRLKSALASLQLLTTASLAVAGLLAQQLDDDNKERQRITQTIQAEAEKLALSEDGDGLLLFAVDESFNSGVVGLAASRLMEVYYRPAIVAWKDETITRASCRSIPEFHITDALDQCADLLVRHGGHAAAAGFTVNNDNYEALKERLRRLAAEQLGGLSLSPVLLADVEMPLAVLPPDILNQIEKLQPCGNGNRQPVFLSRDVEVYRFKAVGRDSSHLKLTVRDHGLYFDAIAFRQGHWADQMPRRIDLMYTVELNEFNGRSSLQLNVRDLRPAEQPE
jgi:single-stranded-DNA-specific exonuclease